MPRIRFSDLPRGLWQHLLERVQEWEISLVDLTRLQQWVRTDPQAPEGDSGEYPTTVLTKGMAAFGQEIE